ncbi:hypothetical protein ACF1BE_29185 [Streptomyces sp. NPDC014991]|uniref:hypothetical protein n=1 Tax=Streptomyces sp. NPDC014991 TaxID=3364935 RepID=UPI003700C3BE
MRFACPAAAAAAPADSVTLPVQDPFAQLSVRTEERTGYERTAFRHWVDADGDGCNTRAEILKVEAVIASAQGPRCALSGGDGYSPYDDRYIQGRSGVPIDHMVPLAVAWGSGACRLDGEGAGGLRQTTSVTIAR